MSRIALIGYTNTDGYCKKSAHVSGGMVQHMEVPGSVRTWGTKGMNAGAFLVVSGGGGQGRQAGLGLASLQC